MKKPKNAQSGRKAKRVSYDSIAAAVPHMHPYTKRELQTAKAHGCPGFRGSRVYPAEALPWLIANEALIRSGGVMDRADLEKRLEEIRKLRIANDAKEGRLIERAWVAERIQRAAGELNAIRIKSEAEHPMRFAAAAGDVAMCRSVVRGIWDDLMANMQRLSKHFQE